MPIQVQTQEQYAAAFLQAWAAQMSTPEFPISPNLPDGDPVKALAQCDAAQATVVQLICAATIVFARATTCVGPDLDSFYAQFAFPRVPAQSAQGTVTLSTPVANPQNAYIPIGTQIQTAGGAIVYQLVADPTQDAYNSALQQYVLPAGQTSINATAQSIVAGSASNVQAGLLNQFVSSQYGVSQVTNPLNISGGEPAQSDPAYRAAFILYINNLSRGTIGAVDEVVGDVPGVVKFTLIEFVQLVGNPVTSIISNKDGYIAVLIDDGTGSPSDSLQSLVLTGLQGVVAWGIHYQVAAPAIVTPALALCISVGPNESDEVAIANVQAYIVQQVNALPIGSQILLSWLTTWAQAADPNVTSVEPESATINDAQANYTPESYQESIITGENVAVTTYSP